MHYLLHAAIQNDSLFLYKQNIVDYSLLAIIDKENKRIRVGILDYMQHYTFEKQIETAIKRILTKEDPTIISPEQYKMRFTEEMAKYFVCMYPDRQAEGLYQLQ